MNERLGRLLRNEDICFYITNYYAYLVKVIGFTKYRVIVDLIDEESYPASYAKNTFPKTVNGTSLILMEDPRESKNESNRRAKDNTKPMLW